MARTLLLKAFWCAGALTGFLFLVKAGVVLALRTYYRPTLEHAYNDVIALREVRTLGILREMDAWITYPLLIGLIATALLGGAIVVLRRAWRPARVIEKASASS